MVDLDDTATFRFPTFIDGGLDPQFSADGTMLMYRSEKELSNAIYIMDMETGNIFFYMDMSLNSVLYRVSVSVVLMLRMPLH